MKSKDWVLRVMVTLLVVGVWVLILKPVLAPTPSEAASAEKVIQAQRFQVVDAEGKVRATLGLDPVGGPGLWFFGHGGKMKVLGGLRVDSRGILKLDLSDEKGEIRILLGVIDNYANLVLCDEQGKPRVKIDSSPSVALSDRGGRARAMLTILSSGSGALVFADERGGVRWAVPPP